MILDGIQSGGGPLILLPENLLHLWEGCFPPSGGRKVEASFRWAHPAAPATDYDRACDVRGYWGIVPVGNGCGLVLGGEPLLTYVAPAPDGAVLVRWRYAESKARLGEALETALDLPDSAADEVFRIFSSPLCLFDAAEAGNAVSDKRTTWPLESTPSRRSSTRRTRRRRFCSTDCGAVVVQPIHDSCGSPSTHRQDLTARGSRAAPALRFPISRLASYVVVLERDR
jgi:hypothetical protein